MNRIATAVLAVLVLAGVPALAGDTMPANIKAIIDRMSHGQMPSEADQKTMEAWSRGQPGAAARAAANGAASDGDQGPSSTMDHESSIDEDEDGAKNLCKTGGHAGFGAAPSQSAYVAMAKQAFDTYAAKMPDGGRILLEGQLDRATNPTWGADLSLVLLTKSSGSAAVVAAASSAQKAPRDALTASNLGVALRGMKDYARAAIALTYAKSLAPDSTVIATNLGWLAMSRHDTKTAGQFFNAALSKNKQMSAALSGDGLIAQCGGKHSQALKFFRASLQNGYSRLADVGVQSAVADIRKDNPGADTGSPADVGPSGKAVLVPAWPDPPIAGSAKEMAQWSQANENSGVVKWGKLWEDSLTTQNATILQIGIKADGGASKTVKGGHTEFRRGFAREVARIRDLKQMLFGHIELAGEHVTKTSQDLTAAIGDGGICSASRPKIEGLYPVYAGKLHADWAEMRIAIGNYYQHVGPAVADITDDNLRKHEQAMLNEDVLSGLNIYAQSLRSVQGVVQFAYWPSDIDCGKVPAIAIKPGTLKPYPLDPNACKSGETHMNFGLVNFNADCEKMTLDFGEGLVGSGEYKFGNDWGNDQLTIFAGVGVSGGLGPLSAGAKTGAYMTFQGGQVMDYGNQSSAGISVGSGPISAGSEASARISAVSGVDVALDSGVHLGGVSPE